MDESKFNLWRACFSFCFVDGFLSPEELVWIEEKLKNLNFSPEQKKILMEDLVSPPKVSSLLPLITSAIDRGFLVNHMRVIAKLDNELSSAEKEKIQIVRDQVLNKVDLVELEKVIAQEAKASYHEDEVYKVHNKHSYVEKIVRDLQKLINPGDYKFPEK